jgi:hypothetical protein
MRHASESSERFNGYNKLAAKKWKSDILLSRYFSVATALDQARRAAVGFGEHVHVAVERADSHAEQLDEMLAIGNAAVEQQLELDAARETMISAVVFVIHELCPSVGLVGAFRWPPCRKNGRKADKNLGDRKEIPIV